MNFKFKPGDLKAIPNILCYFRILMVPLFLYIYYNATHPYEYCLAAMVIIAAGLTDFFDGRIARKYNMITDLGRIIDPVADKLMQFAMLIALIYSVKNMYILVIYLIIKEVTLALAGLIAMNTIKRRLNGAKWYGKVCTAVLYVIMLVLVAFPQLDIHIQNIMLIICAAAITLSFIMYAGLYIKMFKDSKENKKDVLY